MIQKVILRGKLLNFIKKVNFCESMLNYFEVTQNKRTEDEKVPIIRAGLK